MNKTLIALMLPVVAYAGCSAEEPATGNSQSGGETKTLVAYFLAQGHTRAVAEAFRRETGADIFEIEPAVPYAANPYDDSDKIQNEAYNDLRPEVKTFLPESEMAKYDTIFVGTPCWWHQPAMVVCTFLEHYDLSGKVVIPFVTYGATTYLNDTMQKLYKCTPDSRHIPAILPEDLEPENIRQPQNDDAGIDMPTASTVRQWLDRIGYGMNSSGIAGVQTEGGNDGPVYILGGVRLEQAPSRSLYVSAGRVMMAR